MLTVVKEKIHNESPDFKRYNLQKGFNSVEFEPLDGRLFITGHCASGLQYVRTGDQICHSAS